MVKGQFITVCGERFYEITNYDEMQPFFIALASDTDLWMYLSSTGGLTAGRRSPDEALFPYYTDDKITESHDFTGPFTRINDWYPFSDRQQPVCSLSRKIAKSVVGNRIVFCEENHTLGLRFSYLWAPAGKHGWVRRATLENLTGHSVEIHLTDGLQNVLPAGVERKTQNEFSTLVDGYKRTEHIHGTSLVLFRMEAILVDRAEPSESLTCNTVYALGLPEGTDYSASSSKGVRGAFIANTVFTLNAQSSRTWYNVCDVSKDAVQVRQLMHFIASPDAIRQVENSMQTSTDALRRIVALNDGIQHTGDQANDARHFANVLFNTMRGGYYLSYPPASIQDKQDGNTLRHYYEQLPLTFGRRHGDPSRPWNLFSIRVQDEQGNPVAAYQGNWRDIFQNWEALSVSYPLYVNHIIAKFLNATTADGYNPYRISDQGIDWEVIDPDSPWSNIGYWGDHQIIYILKLLELSYDHNPEGLQTLLHRRIFAFANVPYRIKSYAEIVADPKNSIRFDTELHNRIMAAVATEGADAKLMHDSNGQVLHTTMADKLLITLLAKLSNFIPNAGIWMNTLRPEWNDANNALVGYGASMVTLCYMRRYVAFLQRLITTDITIADETAELLHAIHQAVRMYDNSLSFINAVGKAGEIYRSKVYAGLSNKYQTFTCSQLQDFLRDTLTCIDTSIRANKRSNGLYEAYNLIRFTDSDIEITHLYEMLEGQVAVLSTGLLEADEAADLLDALRSSALYREDQRSYMLYPDRQRKSFLELNNLPEEAQQLPVVQKYLGTVLKQDCEGGIHFDAAFRNANNLPDELKDLYEAVFHHHAFTGRSGTFYKYEGLGCIYWHMVSKLLLAVGENIAAYSERTGLHSLSGDRTFMRLCSHYRAIREGIGSHKQPNEYGSFPFDPYSHTPSMAGVQQPGMTGQVKEDILNRFFELGVIVHNGQITFAPLMLTDEDFSNGELHFTYCGTEIIYKRSAVSGQPSALTLTKEQSNSIFARNGEIKQLIIDL